MCLDSCEPPPQLFPNNWRAQKYFNLWRRSLSTNYSSSKTQCLLEFLAEVSSNAASFHLGGCFWNEIQRFTDFKCKVLSQILYLVEISEQTCCSNFQKQQVPWSRWKHFLGGTCPLANFVCNCHHSALWWWRSWGWCVGQSLKRGKDEFNLKLNFMYAFWLLILVSHLLKSMKLCYLEMLWKTSL